MNIEAWEECSREECSLYKDTDDEHRIIEECSREECSLYKDIDEEHSRMGRVEYRRV